MIFCHHCGKENVDDAIQCHACATVLTEHPAAPTAPASTEACPLCGKRDGYKLSVPVRRSFSWLVFLMGGFIIAALHTLSRKRRVTCNHCGGFFNVRTGSSRTFLIIMLIVIALTVLGLVLEFVE